MQQGYVPPQFSERAQSEQKFSLGSLVKNMAVGMLVFTASEAVTNIASRGLVKLASPLLRSAGVALTAASKPSSLGASISSTIPFLKNTPSIGELVGAKLTSTALSGKFGQGVAQFLRTESAFNTAAKANAWTTQKAVESYINPVNATTSKFSRFIGGAAVRATRTMAELPAFYAIDRMFGNLYGLDKREAPPIGDVGGTIKDFAKYAGEAMPGFMAFKSAGPAFRMMKNSIVNNINSNNVIVRQAISTGERLYTQAKAAGNLFKEAITSSYANTGDRILQERMQHGLGRSLSRGLSISLSATKTAYGRLKQINAQTLSQEAQRVRLSREDRYFGQLAEGAYYAATGDGSQSDAGNGLAWLKMVTANSQAERAKRTSTLAYALSDRSKPLSTKVNLYSYVDRKTQSLRSTLQSTTLSAQRRTALEETLARYEQIGRTFESRQSEFTTDVFSLMHVNDRHSFVDLNMISKRGFMEKTVNSLEKFNLTLPMNSMNILLGGNPLTGKPLHDIRLPVFKMLGVGSLVEKTPTSIMVKKGENLYRYSGANATVEQVPINTFGGYITGRPYEAVYDSAGRISFNFKGTDSRSFNQRFKAINNEVLEKAYNKMRQKASHDKSFQSYYEKKIFDMDMIETVNRLVKLGVDPLSASADEITKATANKSFAMDNLILTGRKKLESIKMKYELGEYGSGDHSIFNKAITSFSKFYDRASNYRYMSMEGRANDILAAVDRITPETIAHMKASTDIRGGLGSFMALNQMAELQKRGLSITQTQARHMIVKTNIEDIISAANSTNSSRIQSITGSIDDAYNTLERTLSSDTSRHLSKNDIQLFSKAKDMIEAARNSGGVSSLYDQSGVHLGIKMTDAEYVRKMALMAESTTSLMNGNKNIYGEFVSTFDTLIGQRRAVGHTARPIIREDSAAAVARDIGGFNPFSMQRDLRDLENKYNFTRGAQYDFDILKNIQEAGATIKTNVDTLESIITGKGKEEFLATYRKYRRPLDIASKSAHGLLSDRSAEMESIAGHSSSELLNRTGGYTMLLDKINMKNMTDAQKAVLPDHMAANVASYFFAERLNRVASGFGMGVNATQNNSASSIMKAFALKRGVPALAMLAGWQVMDQVTDVLNLGAFDEGLNTFVAEKYIQLQDMNSRIRDNIGITQHAKYLEGLMPGFVDSPGSKLMRTVGLAFGGALMGTFAGNPALGASIGLAASAGQDFGLNDLARSNEENRDIWSGNKKVPIRAGARWTLSKAFYAGDKITGWAPHWFAQMKARGEYSDTQYGSPLEALIYRPWPMIGVNPVGSLIDPYHYERVNYEKRPYLYTGQAFNEVPFVGPLLSATAGKIIKPAKTMHTEALSAFGSGTKWENQQARLQMYAESALLIGEHGEELSGQKDVSSVSPYSAQATADAFVRQGIYQPLGLFGFVGKTASQVAFGKDTPFESEQLIESADRMTSSSRAYWDQNMGDMLMSNEFLRRMITQSKAGQSIVPNVAPSWLPGEDSFRDYSKGDIYAKIPLGEVRLPGAAYERFNKVNMTFPIGASSAGYDPLTMAMNMVGLSQGEDDDLMESAVEGTKIHRLMQETYMANGLIRAAEKMVYDPVTDINGFVDMIGRDGEIIEVKTVESVADLENLTGPKKKHKAQVNVYMNATDTNYAKIIYAARDNPSKTKEFIIGKDIKLYMQTIRNVTEARRIATKIPKEAMGIGAGYSHIDRLKILADVAPFSKEYYNEKTILDEQARLGVLEPNEYSDYYEAIKMADAQARPTDVYPDRFWGKLKNPETLYNITSENIKLKATADAVRRGDIDNVSYDNIRKGMDAQYNMFNLNSNIKDAAQYNMIERVAGATWEGAMKVQIPYVSRKLFQYWTPMDAYKHNILQGTKDSYWNTPYESFVEPSMTQMLSATNPLQGAVTGSFLGSFMGPAGSFVGGLIGSAYGGLRGVAEGVNLMEPFVRRDIQEARKIERYFDDMKAQSSLDVANTGNFNAKKMYEGTLIGSEGVNDFRGSFSALPSTEKAYVSLIATSGNQAMARDLMRYLPKENAARLERLVNGGNEIYQADTPSTYVGPSMDWNIINDDVSMNKMKYETMKDSSVNTYVSSLGWKNQIAQFERTNALVDLRNPGLNINRTMAFSDVELKNTIYGIMRECGITGTINTAPDSDESITIEII